MESYKKSKEKRERFNKHQVIVLASLWLAYLLSFVARLIWSSVMPVADVNLGLSEVEGTSYITAFYLGYAITALPGGILSDKIGYRRMIAISLGGIALGTALMSTVAVYEIGFAYRLILGLFSGPLNASCLSAIGDTFADNQRGSATGILMTCTSMGITVVNLYAPSLASTYNWQTAMLATAAIPLAISVLCLFTLKKAPSSFNSITRNIPPEVSPTGVKENLILVCKNKDILLIALAGLFATGATWGVTNWTNLFMTANVGLSSVAAGFITALYGVFAFISKPFIGVISDHLNIRKNILAAVCLFLFAPALLLFARVTTPNALYITGPLLGIGAFMYSPLTNALSVSVSPVNCRGTAAGFVNLFNQIGSLIAPIILGSILSVTSSYQTSLMILAIFPIIGAVTLLFVKLPKAEESHSSSKSS